MLKRRFFAGIYVLPALTFLLAAISTGNCQAASPDSFEVDNSLFDPSPDNPTLSLPLAKPISASTPQLHTLDIGGDIATADRDFVSFTLGATSDVLLQCDVSVGPGITVIRLFNAGGTQLAISSNPSGAATTKLIATNLAPGLYYAGVEESGLVVGAAQTIESYFLTLQTSAPGAGFPPVITSVLTASGVTGADFTYTLFAVGSGTVSFGVSGLPSGLGLNGNQILGTPRQAGTFNVTLTAANGIGANDSKTLVLNISGFGIITTIAGNGVAGFGGDGDLALNAQFNTPNGLLGICADPAGNVYLSDSANNRLRRIDAVTQIITTVAGNGLFPVGDNGPGASAYLNFPTQVAADTAGDVFIADTLNNRIRRVDGASGAITTVAGNGAAGFSDNVAAALAGLNAPSGVAVDPTGATLFISDTVNHVIRKVSGGTITTVAGFVTGTPASGNSGDGGPGISAKLNTPTGLAFDSVAGILYIADTGNNRVRTLNTATGIINAFAGTGVAGFFGDGAAATSAKLNLPRAIAIDGTKIYIADGNNNRVRMVTGGNISTVAGSGSGVSSGDGGTALAAGISQPYALGVLSPGGPVLVADSVGQRIRQFTVGGNIASIAGTGVAGFTGDGAAATAAQLTTPRGLAVTGASIFVGDSGNQRVRKISGGNISTIAGGGLPGDGGVGTSLSVNAPMGTVSDAAGNIYFADTGYKRVRKYTASTGVVSTVAGNGAASFSGDGGPALNASLNSPQGVAMDAAGNLYIADHTNNRIRMVNAAGIISTVAGSGAQGLAGDNGPATAASLNLPNNVTFDSAGNMYIVDTNNNAIRKVAVGSGTITTVAGTGVNGFAGDGGPATSALLSRPKSAAVDSTGTLFIEDSGNSRIRRVDAVSGLITTFCGNGTSTFSGDGGAATSAALATPQSMAFDASGSLIVGDSGNRRVRKIAVASAPKITSPTSASGIQNAFFMYRITASGHPAPTLSAANLPDGLFLDEGLISGFPTVSGATDVVLSATNILGTATAPLRLIIARPAGSADNPPLFNSPPVLITVAPNPGVVNSVVSFVAPSTSDPDGDLVAFDWDFGDGATGTGSTTTHVYAAAGIYIVTLKATDGVASVSGSTPVPINDPSVTQSAIVSKASFKFNFVKKNADLITISGTVPVRTGFVVANQPLTLFIGNFKKAYTLSSKGSFSTKTDSVKLTTTTKPHGFLDVGKKFYAGNFNITLKAQTLSDALASLGFVKNLPTSTPLRVPVVLSVGGDSYAQDLTVVYSSSATSGSGSKINNGQSLGGRN